MPSEDLADNMTVAHMRPLVRWRMLSPYRVIRMAQDVFAMFVQRNDGLPETTYTFDRELRMGGRARYGGRMVRLMTRATHVIEYQGAVTLEHQPKQTFTLAAGGLRTEEEADAYDLEAWADNVLAGVGALMDEGQYNQ